MVYQHILIDNVIPLEQASFIKISVLFGIKPIIIQRKSGRPKDTLFQ